MKFRKGIAQNKVSRPTNAADKRQQTSNVTKNKPIADMKRYRVEGLSRSGVRYVKVVGHPGEWYSCGIEGQKSEIIRPDAKTIDDVLRIGKRLIGFVPICVREIV